MIKHSKELTRDALHIWNHGACNPLGIMYTLRALAREAMSQEGVPGVAKSPEIRLVFHQLLWVIYKADPYTDLKVFQDADCFQDVDECKKKLAEAKEAEARKSREVMLDE